MEQKLEEFLTETKVEELMINTMIFEHAKRLRSYQIVADIWKSQQSKKVGK